MTRIKEIELVDILKELPDVVNLDCRKYFKGEEYDIFFCALGFEERCLTIPEQLADLKDFKCKQAFYFEYSTNLEDNAVNRPRLIQAYEKFAKSWDFMQCDVDDFTKKLRGLLNRIVEYSQKPKIIFDISVCSSKLLLSVMKILFEFNIYIRIVYSEAAIYHPTYEEFEKEPEKWTTEEGFGATRGVGRVIPSPEHPGTHRENPDLTIVFPTFKPERTKKIITYIDESLLIRPDNRIIWIIGDPHMDEDTKSKRKSIIRKINEIPEEATSYDVSTLNYKKTIEILYQIYRSKNLDFHINISALCSKMQCLGISLFWYIMQDISIYLAIPKEYNPKQYSEGCIATWQIDFDDTANTRGILDKVGQLEIIKNSGATFKVAQR